MNENATQLTSQVKELIAISASIGGNCLPCLRYHFAEAKKLGVLIEEIKETIELAKLVKERPINDIYKLAEDLISREQIETN